MEQTQTNPKDFPRRLTAEAVGTAFLLAAVVGSGIMGERLAGGNEAVALLANTVSTGAALTVLILTFGPISGAHFNPAVTVGEGFLRGLPWRDVPGYVAAQIIGAVVGVVVANLMFDEPAVFFSQKHRVGAGQWLGEFVATFGLLSVIQGCVRLAELGGAVRRGRLHHRGLLVHLVHVVRQSRRDHSPDPLGHVRRHLSDACARVHRHAVHRRRRGHRVVLVAGAARAAGPVEEARIRHPGLDPGSRGEAPGPRIESGVTS